MTSAEIANLVSKAFSHHKPDELTQKQQIIYDYPPSLFGGVLKIMGLDEQKVGTLAMNSIVFVAQMVRNGMQVVAQYTMRKVWEYYLMVRFVRDKISGNDIQTLPPSAPGTFFIPIEKRKPLLK